MTSLIARLQAATGPDRELDGRIWCALNGKRFKGVAISYDGVTTQVFYTEPPKRTERVAHKIPAFTGSIDAALTLVPDGWRWDDLCRDAEAYSFPAGLYIGEVEYGVTLSKYAEDGRYAGPSLDAQHDFLAIALCIAALKARGVE
jgi:hypothetical protein